MNTFLFSGGAQRPSIGGVAGGGLLLRISLTASHERWCIVSGSASFSPSLFSNSWIVDDIVYLIELLVYITD